VYREQTARLKAARAQLVIKRNAIVENIRQHGGWEALKEVCGAIMKLDQEIRAISAQGR
jgi:hypothetical protein